MYCTGRRLERPVADRDAGHQRRDQQECCVITGRQVDDAGIFSIICIALRPPWAEQSTQAPANWIASTTRTAHPSYGLPQQTRSLKKPNVFRRELTGQDTSCFTDASMSTDGCDASNL